MAWDVIAVVGLMLTTIGLWSIHPPVAIIAVGVVLVWVAKRGYERETK